MLLDIVHHWFHEESGVLYFAAGSNQGVIRNSPLQCRATVLKLAHGVLFAGHLVRDETTQRILHRFYWPRVYKDVADFVRSCHECQKTASSKAPLILLPMNSHRHHWTPTKKSYRQETMPQDPFPMKSVDAEHVDEELLTLFL